MNAVEVLQRPEGVLSQARPNARQVRRSAARSGSGSRHISTGSRPAAAVGDAAAEAARGREREIDTAGRRSVVRQGDAASRSDAGGSITTAHGRTRSSAGEPRPSSP